MHIFRKKGLWIVLPLAIAGILLLIRKERNALPDFSVQHPGKIQKIILSAHSGSLILKKSNNSWHFSDGQPVRKGLPGAFLETLKRIEIKFPVSMEELLLTRQDTGIESIAVSLFNGLLPVQRFTVYKVTMNPYGNIMTKRKSGPAYVCYLPGHPGNLGNWFTPDKGFWKPHLLFTLVPAEIESVKLCQKRNPEKSFKLVKTSRSQYILTNPESGDTVKNFYPSKINRYLSYFQRIPFERYLNDTIPGAFDPSHLLYSLTVRSKGLPEKKIRLFYIEKPEGEIDPDKAIAIINNETSPVLVHYFDLDPILKEIDYFTSK